MLAQLIHVETAVTAGGGLSSSYSSVADAVITVLSSAETAVATDAVAVAMITIAAVLSSGF